MVNGFMNNVRNETKSTFEISYFFSDLHVFCPVIMRKILGLTRKKKNGERKRGIYLAKLVCRGEEQGKNRRKISEKNEIFVFTFWMLEGIVLQN